MRAADARGKASQRPCRLFAFIAGYQRYRPCRRRSRGGVLFRGKCGNCRIAARSVRSGRARRTRTTAPSGLSAECAAFAYSYGIDWAGLIKIDALKTGEDNRNSHPQSSVCASPSACCNSLFLKAYGFEPPPSSDSGRDRLPRCVSPSGWHASSRPNERRQADGSVARRLPPPRAFICGGWKIGAC